MGDDKYGDRALQLRPEVSWLKLTFLSRASMLAFEWPVPVFRSH